MALFNLRELKFKIISKQAIPFYRRIDEPNPLRRPQFMYPLNIFDKS
ncbi:hypothetical protein L915_09420 [Phytophthora nicotianae]|uniref:Uncharacterized protein n=1 Tax=Phytophthora nicotianae TaxID=4792 RepID=W2J0J2_PHYNI|nr:hypothetical protein L915_09420 [Phytophthora nicotianae]ETL39307.1 hypothetical protein L916_09323 [Phytophthora nicotianae]